MSASVQAGMVVVTLSFDPLIAQLGPFQLGWHGLFSTLALLVVLWLATPTGSGPRGPPSRHRAQRQGGRREHPVDRVDLSSLTALVDKLRQQNLELAGRVGFYRNEIEHLCGELKAPQAPKDDPMPPATPRWPEEPAPVDPPPRPWWRFWG